MDSGRRRLRRTQRNAGDLQRSSTPNQLKRDLADSESRFEQIDRPRQQLLQWRRLMSAPFDDRGAASAADLLGCGEVHKLTIPGGADERYGTNFCSQIDKGRNLNSDLLGLRY